jgi:hypothetical protein
MKALSSVMGDGEDLSAQDALAAVQSMKDLVATKCSPHHLASELNYCFRWENTPMGREPWSRIYNMLGTTPAMEPQLRLELALLLDELEKQLLQAVQEGTYGE